MSPHTNHACYAGLIKGRALIVTDVSEIKALSLGILQGWVGYCCIKEYLLGLMNQDVKKRAYIGATPHCAGMLNMATSHTHESL